MNIATEHAADFRILSAALPSSKPGSVETVVEQTKPEVEQPWNVIVHNDPINLMSFVTMVFQKVFGYSKEKAQRHMLEVHQRGRSVVWSGGRERAEHYVHLLQQHHLLSTIEHAEM